LAPVEVGEGKIERRMTGPVQLKATLAPALVASIVTWIIVVAVLWLILAVVAQLTSAPNSWIQYSAIGALASLGTLLAAEAFLRYSPLAKNPIGALLSAIAIRSALPLLAILLVSISRPNWLGNEFLIYCLPMYTATLVAGTRSDIARAQQNNMTVASPAR
jgi:hypothetical protein